MNVQSRLFPAVEESLGGLGATIQDIERPHRAGAERLAAWISENLGREGVLPVVIVCTGNSRRSILGSTMGNLVAAYLGLSRVHFHSAGTAPSAFNPRTIQALRDLHVQVEPTGDEAPRGDSGEPNPRYRVRWGDAEGSTATEFSKALGAEALPSSGFAAVMVCDEADAGCPIVPGAAIRISLPFPDPKTFDGTAGEATQYAATRDALGRAMMAVLGEVHRRLPANASIAR